MDSLLASPLFDYAAPTDFDEAVDPTGAVRPAWRSLVAALGQLGSAEVEQRRRQADRLIAAQGASYLYHEDHDGDTDVSRPWRLDPVPLVIGRDEWATLSAGIAQRAELLDRVLEDLYGERRLLFDGVIPPEAAFASPAYQWPVVDADAAPRRSGAGTVEPASPSLPTGRRRLVVYGADLVRTSDGRWRVLRDLTDAPAGAGYALLNRTVLTRLLPDVYRELGVVRPAEFFARLGAALSALAPEDRPNPRTVLLTAGLGHPSYFEHSYLAEQLGYHLAEGGDLTVRDARVWLRSLDGLEPVDVLLRRVEDSDADPLELGAGRWPGVPGLLRAVRHGGVGLANSLGSALASSLALQPFLGAAAQRMLGRQLALPALDTLWCGDPDQRAEVLRRFDSMVLHDAASPEGERAVFARDLDDHERAVWQARIETEPARFVAQPKVDFATTPLMRDGRVQPGTAVLRVQAVLGPDQVSVLPGGLGRVLDPHRPVVTQTAGMAKDVWVVGGEAERRDSSRHSIGSRAPQIDLRTSLPTRAAEALYWVGRRAERSEAIARLARTLLVRAQQDPGLLEADPGWDEWAVAGLRAVRSLPPGPASDASESAQLTPPLPRLEAEIRDALHGSGGLAEQVAGLRRAASSVRGYLSTSTWQVLGDLTREPTPDAERLTSEGLEHAIVALSALSGLVMESTVRGPSWRLLDLGRRLERTLVLLGAIESMLAPVPEPLTAGARYEVVLAAHESLVAYRRRHRSDARADEVLDLLAGDDANPRALAFQLDRIAEHIAALPGPADRSALEALVDDAARAVLRQPWHAGPPVVVSRRRPVIDQLVIDVRGPLLDLAGGFVRRWFADPALVRHIGPRP